MSFTERVSTFLKSLGGEAGEGEGKKKEEEGGDQDTDLENTGEGEDEGKDEGMEKSGLTDATEIMTALVDELHTFNKSIEAMNKRQEGLEKSQADLGEAIVNIAEMVSKIGNAPNPVKTALTKSLQAQDGGGEAGDRLTRAEFEQAQKALARACAEKRITIFKSSMLESEMQKAMSIPGYQMSLEDRALIARELKTA